MTKYIRGALDSRMAAFVFFSSSASIISLFGWAAENFLEYSPELLGIISFVVIGLMFLFAMFLLISAFISFEKIKEMQSDYVLSHRITHNLRNSTTVLQDLEFQTVKKIDSAESKIQFLDILENDELKRKSIIDNLGSKITGAVANQIKTYFSANNYKGNVRVTIKSLIPEGKSQLEWRIETLVVDPSTWDTYDRIIEEAEDEVHIIKDNSDFREILSGKDKYFICNDLAGLLEDKYANSSKEWRRKYNSTLVVPIKNKPDGKKNTVYYGFITVDSLNPENKKLFSDEQGSPSLNILAHAADAIAVWFIKNDNHTKVIKDALVQREGILVIARAIEERSNIARVHKHAKQAK